MGDIPLFDVSGVHPEPPKTGIKTAATAPIARVWIETGLPQLDRPFEYLIPEKLDEAAVIGAKVRVDLAGRQVNGWLVGRSEEAETEKSLRPIRRVLSPHPIMTAKYLAFLQGIAERNMGVCADMFRLAVPPRVAAVDRDFEAEQTPQVRAGDLLVPEEKAQEKPGQTLYQNPWATAQESSFLEAVSQRKSPRAVLVAPRSSVAVILEAIQACLISGRRALVVVPDARRLSELEHALEERAGRELGKNGSEQSWVARLNAEDAPTGRYRAYLRALYGHVDLVIGTRCAAYAPMENLGLVALWDDGDSSLSERRAPYPHAREVLLSQALCSDSAFLLAGHVPTSEGMRLHKIGWATLLWQRPGTTERPRVSVSGSEYESSRDPLAAKARIPSMAFNVARDALHRGPVLVHVSRAGYAPVVQCASCRERSLCAECHGPLIAEKDSEGKERLLCSWCHKEQEAITCAQCGSSETIRPVSGVLRTAEELGRAFPGVPVVSSSSAGMKQEISPRGALVVATAGAEPRVIDENGVEVGYQAALILDGDQELSRDSLRAQETVLRRWFAIMSRVAVHGQVVVSLSETGAMNALVAYDPVTAMSRDLALRTELGLPPALRSLSLTGTQKGVLEFWDEVKTGLQAARGSGCVDDAGVCAVRVIGPTVLAQDGERHRLLLFFPYALAPALSLEVRARKTIRATQRGAENIQIHCDPPEVL